MSKHSSQSGWSPRDVPAEQYDSERVWNRILNFHNKRKENKEKFHGIQISIVIISAIITVGNALGGGSIWVSIASSLLGATIIALTGIQELKKYQQNWILYGSNEETLRREYYLWKNEAGEYSNISSEHDRRKLLVEKVESILLSQYSSYFAVHTQRHTTPTDTSTNEQKTPSTTDSSTSNTPIKKPSSKSTSI